jgi:sugar lactone lactonase YvrE
MGMLALGIVLMTVVVPALSGTPTGPRMETFGGTGLASVSADGNPARSTSLIGPNGIVVSPTGEVYFADGDRIRKVDRNGLVQTVAGTGSPGFAGDGGPPLQSQLWLSCFGTPAVVGLAIDANGDVFFSDTCNERVRKITPDGVIRTVAGGGGPRTAGVGDRGPGVDALLNDPRGLALDGLGDLFIADTGDNRVRKLDPTGIISTVAGNGMLGWGGDGGPANLAELSAPEAVALKGDDLYISDAGNERIRRVSGGSGVITTVAGDGSSGFSGDGGPAIEARLSLPMGLAFDGRGNLYVTDSGNDRVRKIDLAGVITTVAGNGHAGFSGDGKPATSAMLNLPVAIAFGSAGEMYIADGQNNRIRVVRFDQQ